MALLFRFLALALVCGLLLSSSLPCEARYGSRDDRGRKIDVEKNDPDEVRFNSALSDGAVKNVVSFRIKVSSNKLEFRVSFRLQNSTTNSSSSAAEISNFKLRFDKIVEYVETNNNTGFQGFGNSTDLVLNQIDFGNWGNIIASGPDVRNVTTYSATTLNKRFSFAVSVGPQAYNVTFANNSITITPNLIKFEVALNFTDYTYANAASRLALRTKLESSGETRQSIQSAAPHFSLAMHGGDDDHDDDNSGNGGNGGNDDNGGNGGRGNDDSGDDDEDDSKNRGKGNDDRGRGRDHPDDDISDAVGIGNFNNSKAVLGVFDWLPRVTVDGQNANLTKSATQNSCDDQNPGEGCINFWLAVEAIRPRLVVWDPTLGYGTAYVDANTGENNPPTDNSSSATGSALPSYLMSLIIPLFMIVNRW